MDVMWLFVAIVVIVIIVVALFALSGTLTTIIKRPTTTAITEPVQPPSIQQSIPNTYPIVNNTNNVNNVKNVDNDTIEEDSGEITSVSKTDGRYIMKSDYPGIQGEELILTKPLRRRIRLCENGGFLRSYNGTDWRMIPYIIIDRHRIYYDKTGHFRLGGSYMKRLALAYAGDNYVLEIANRM